MSDVTEDSPWHRESSVAIHTDMVVMNLLNIIDTKPNTNTREVLSTLFAAAFHDVGKPRSKIAKNSNTRGDYFSFSGHELQSARLWEDFFLSSESENGITIDLFGVFSDCKELMRSTTIMIEYHRPWSIKGVSKLDGIGLTLSSMGTLDGYFNLLLADNQGRVVDDSTVLSSTIKKIDKFKSTFSQYENINGLKSHDSTLLSSTIEKLVDLTGTNLPESFPTNDIQTIIIPIAPSGSGKSTFAKNCIDLYGADNIVVHSMDTIRSELYGADYEEAFIASTKDSEFYNKVQADFHKKVSTGKHVYVDNKNTSKRSRTKYISHAKRRGLYAKAVLFPLTLAQLMERRATRTDKVISKEVVKKQFFKVSQPLLGFEFDSIEIKNP